MRKIVFGSLLITALLAMGCGSSPLHQSLMLHEHRQLENALYVAHAQIADLKRENKLLRQQQTSDFMDIPERPYNGSQDKESDLFLPLEMPKVILPDQPGTSEVPKSLRGSQTTPIWSPRR